MSSLMVILLSLLELEGQTPYSLEDMPWPPSTALYRGEEEDDHLEDDGLGHFPPFLGKELWRWSWHIFK